MSNVVWTEVRELHTQIPTTSESRIGRFITDAEYVVKSKLAPYVEAWTDLTEPGVVRVIIKHLACWTELQSLYGSQVEEFHEFVQNFKEFPWDLLHEIIDAAKEGLDIDDEFTEKVLSKVSYNTELRTKIFDLGDVLSQIMHPEDDDLRYGEDTA
jgi:hypothetical protein